MTLQLGDAPVFLSGSFPSGERGRQFEPFDPGGIADAVSACARAVLTGGGTLVFGGHPTITPLVLLIAAELQLREKVHIYQSRWFADRITEETRRLEALGLGLIHWTDASATLEQSLELLRHSMLTEHQFLAGTFIGGMEGIISEYLTFLDLRPGVPALPVGAPGGAARMLVDRARRNLPSELASRLESDRYPELFFDLLRVARAMRR